MDLKIRMSEFFNNYQKVPILNYLRQNIVAELIVGIPKVYSLLKQQDFSRLILVIKRKKK